jgi:hypothetical protein
MMEMTGPALETRKRRFASDCVVADTVVIEPVSPPLTGRITGNFLSISTENRFPTQLSTAALENLVMIPVDYAPIEVVSCYSAKYAIEAREQAT